MASSNIPDGDKEAFGTSTVMETKRPSRTCSPESRWRSAHQKIMCQRWTVHPYSQRHMSCHSTSFERFPRVMTQGALEYTERCLSMFPHPDGLHATMPPTTLVLGCRHRRPKFTTERQVICNHAAWEPSHSTPSGGQTVLATTLRSWPQERKSTATLGTSYLFPKLSLVTCSKKEICNLAIDLYRIRWKTVSRSRTQSVATIVRQYFHDDTEPSLTFVRKIHPRLSSGDWASDVTPA